MNRNDLDWADARILRDSVRAAKWMHRTDAEAVLAGSDVAGRRRVFGLAWSRNWIDFCGQYVVAPPRR